MTDFSPNQIQEIASLEKTFINCTFKDGVSKVEQMTNDYPIVQREQYRLFCSFCLYKIHQKTLGNIPEQITNFHHKLLSDAPRLTSNQIKERWELFGIKSPGFIRSLEIIANGDRDLERVIRFIKTPPSGKNYLNFLNDNSDQLQKALDLYPGYLHFLPRNLNGTPNLITKEEYDQVQMKA